jgi:coatomer protein complex subunit gamma
VAVVMEATDGDDFRFVAIKPIVSMPYGAPGQAFVTFEKPEGACSLGKFSNTLTFYVKEVDPSTGEADEEGYEDEYQLEDLEVTAADYILKTGVSNFRNTWDTLDPELECSDEYGLGARESLQEAIQAVSTILGMQPCEGTDVVPSNARSHTCLLAGQFLGGVQVLVRLSVGIDAQKQVAMKLVVRSEDRAVSSVIHEIIANA